MLEEVVGEPALFAKAFGGKVVGYSFVIDSFGFNIAFFDHLFQAGIGYTQGYAEALR